MKVLNDFVKYSSAIEFTIPDYRREVMSQPNSKVQAINMSAWWLPNEHRVAHPETRRKLQFSRNPRLFNRTNNFAHLAGSVLSRQVRKLGEYHHKIFQNLPSKNCRLRDAATCSITRYQQFGPHSAQHINLRVLHYVRTNIYNNKATATQCDRNDEMQR
jgi:hypothetical protein